MMSAIFRGFDFPARDIGDQLRFCNPLLSFDAGEEAPIFLARDLDWQYEGGERGRWLTPVDEDEVESFATLVLGEPRRICRGEGVVLMGERFFSAAREVGIDPDRDRSVQLMAIPEARCWVGLASAELYGRFASRLTGEAEKTFDGELSGVVGKKLSAIGEAALFLLRKCGLTSPTALAIRQLAAARVARQTDRYRRLLIRFSLELGETEDDIHKRVGRHLEIASGSTEDRSSVIPEQPWGDWSAGFNISDDTKRGLLVWERLCISYFAQNTDPVHFYLSPNNSYDFVIKTYIDKSDIGNRQIYNPGIVRSRDKEKYSPPKSNLHMEIGVKKLPGLSRFGLDRFSDYQPSIFPALDLHHENRT